MILAMKLALRNISTPGEDVGAEQPPGRGALQSLCTGMDLPVGIISEHQLLLLSSHPVSLPLSEGAEEVTPCPWLHAPCMKIYPSIFVA